MSTLGQRLSRSIPKDFFRPLTSSEAPAYIDCLERLIEAAGESGRLHRADARAVVQEAVSNLDWTGEGGAPLDIRAKTSRVLNGLFDAQWIEDFPESFHERWVVISPASRPLLQMLRELSTDEVGELKSFADGLERVCIDLEIADALDPEKQTPDSLRTLVNDLVQRLEHTISKLYAVEKVIHGYEQRQLHTESGSETLRLTYGDFSEGQHMICYDVLHRRGLLPRLHRARNTVRDASEQPAVQQHLAAGLAAQLELSEEQSSSRAASDLEKIVKLLGGIRQQAHSVDARVASFYQLSKQRIFYQSQIRGRRLELAKTVCEAINARWAGKRFSDLAGDPWFNVRAPDVKIFYGPASLTPPRRPRVRPSLALDAQALPPPDETEQARLERMLRAALTPRRAARLIKRFMPASGDAVSTGEMSIETQEALLDLLAAASFDHYVSPNGTLKWKIIPARRLTPLEPAKIPRAAMMEWLVESFRLERIS